MSQSEFPRHLIDELDRLLIQIRTINDQAEALVTRARDIAALAKRSVSENIKVHVVSMKAEEAIRQADTAIEREVQREVERRERSIEEGRVVPRGGSWAADAALRTAERKAHQPDIWPKTGGIVSEPAPDTFIVNERFPGEWLLGHAVRSVVLPKDMPAAERAAVIADIAELSGHEPVTSGIDLGAGDSVTVETLVQDGKIIASRVVDVAPEPEQDALASGVATEQEIPAVAPAGEDDTEADEETPPADSSAPVDQAPSLIPLTQQAAELPEPFLSAAVEAAKIEPKDLSPPAAGLRHIADHLYREIPKPTEAAIEAGRINADLARITARKVQDKFYEDVMILWSTTMLTDNQIAKRLLTTKSLVTTIIERARADGDERVERKTYKSPAKSHPKQEPDMPSNGVSAPPPNLPFVANSGVTIEENAMPPAHHTHISAGICVVDLEENKVYGKKGHWTTSPEVARTVAKLNRGHMFSQDTIRIDCGWPTPDHLRRGITPMIERLRDCGIDMISLPSGLKLKD